MANLMTDTRAPIASPVELLAVVGGFSDVVAGGKTTKDEVGDTSYLDSYLEHLEQLGEVAGELGYVGLQGICMLFQENLRVLLERDGDLDDQAWRTLNAWPKLVQNYLESPPIRKTVSKALTNHLRLQFWETPLAAEDANFLNGLLLDAQQGAANEEDVEAKDEVVDTASLADEGTDVNETAILSAQSADDHQSVFVAAETESADAAADADGFVDEGMAADEADILSLLSADDHQSVFVTEETGSADSGGLVDEGMASDEADVLGAPPADDHQSVFVAEEPESADADKFVDEGVAADEADILNELSTDNHQSVFVAEETGSADADGFVDEGMATDEVEVLGAPPEDDHQSVFVAEETEGADAAADADDFVDEGMAADEADILNELSTDDHQSVFVAEKAGSVVGDEDGFVSHETAEITAWQPEESREEEMPPELKELVDLLIAEIPLMEEPLGHLLELELAADGGPVDREGACELYADYLDRFGEAAESVGFAGLHQVVAVMRENLSLLAVQPRALSAGEMDALAAWSGYAGIYLNAPHNASACQAFIEWLQLPDWPRPLTTEEAEELLALLQTPTLLELELEEEIEARPQQATPDDVSLALPEDVNSALLDALLQELPTQTQTFSEAIQSLISGGSLEDVNIAQRMAHTLKGAGNTVGVFGLANLTHHLEDILVALAKQKALPTHSLAMSLMNAADCLEAMGEALCGMGEPPDNAQSVMQEVLDLANRIDREGLPEADDEAQSPGVMPAPVPAASSGEQGPAESAKQPQTTEPSPASRGRVATGLVDDLLRLGGETIILSGQVHERVRRIDERMRSLEEEFDRLQRLGGELERLIDIRDLSTDRGGQDESVGFDPLEMDQYNELHTASRMLVETATDASQMGSIVKDQLQQLDTMLLTQERLNREAQETVLSARMVPIKTVVPRLQRSVRQTCRLTGKKVELHVSGADTLMDGEVLSELIDPLMHILRNAVDHGIESADERSAAGKLGGGNIRLDFQREGNNILVRCRDDGSGLDYSAIRRAAESRGLLKPGKEASEEELANFLLMPNFSTRSEVTQTSGRGVGLDVVYSHVLTHGGSLDLKSESGKGSTAELRLPVSLISTHALLVRVRGQVMAVADRGIERILHANDGSQRKLGDQVTYQVDDGMHPLRELEDILQLGSDHREHQRAPMPVLLVRDRTGITAVRVQEVLAGTDLVVKEFGRYLPRLPGIIGATILGDGAVTPVLDLPELMSGTRGNSVRAPIKAVAEAVDELERGGSHLPMALVVDDSLSARRALAQIMADAGYEVREARDGHEAVGIVVEKRPDIVLADMEMPRMNGIELTSHLRSRPDTADLPVVMITSRSTAKHREQAEAAGVNVYLTKPFLDDQLLDHVAELRGQL